MSKQVMGVGIVVVVAAILGYSGRVQPQAGPPNGSANPTQPSITSALPGIPAPGILTIRGGNFGSQVGVTFGSTSLTTLSVSSTEITASMLPGTIPGSYLLTVSNLSSAGVVLAKDSITVSISPSGGQGGGSTRIHASSVSGPYPIPSNTFGVPQILRSITFTPGSSNDVVLYVQVTGTVSTTSIDATSMLFLTVLDSNNKIVFQKRVMFALGFVPPPPPNAFLGDGLITPGNGVPYQIESSVISGFGGSSFPSSSYTVQLLVSNGNFTIGQIDSVQFRIFVAEGATEASPSANITG